jgi:hypothetical protein
MNALRDQNTHIPYCSAAHQEQLQTESLMWNAVRSSDWIIFLSHYLHMLKNFVKPQLQELPSAVFFQKEAAPPKCSPTVGAYLKQHSQNQRIGCVSPTLGQSGHQISHHVTSSYQKMCSKFQWPISKLWRTQMKLQLCQLILTCCSTYGWRPSIAGALYTWQMVPM